MMQENQMGQPNSCNCSMCMHKHGHGNFFLRLLLGLIILLFVFWLGMQIGEFKGSFEGGYGSGYGMHNVMYYRTGGLPMMQNGSGLMGSQPVIQTAPAPTK